MSVKQAVGIVSVGVLCLGVTNAHSKEQTTNQPDAGSLAALTLEVHQLRLAVEDATRSQSQIQALAVYLSAEQSRLVQLSSRLDAARTELNAAVEKSRDQASAVANSQAALANSTLDPKDRLAIEADLPSLKQRADRAAQAEQAARSRETELYQALQTEEARWGDLISRLEQSIKK